MQCCEEMSRCFKFFCKKALLSKGENRRNNLSPTALPNSAMCRSFAHRAAHTHRATQHAQCAAAYAHRVAHTHRATHAHRAAQYAQCDLYSRTVKGTQCYNPHGGVVGHESPRCLHAVTIAERETCAHRATHTRTMPSTHTHSAAAYAHRATQ